MENFIKFEKTEFGEQVNFLDSRAYQKRDNFFPGVTFILSVISKGKQFENWLKSNGFNADYLAREAMNQGSHVHKGIEILLNNKEITVVDNNGNMIYTQHEWTMINRFYEFWTNCKPEKIEVEKVLVSDFLGYGGQLDFICKINGELWLIDFKTGSIYDSAYMQLAAYGKLWDEYNPSTPIQKYGIMHLEALTKGADKKGETMQGKGWKLIEIPNVERHFADFQNVHQIWKREYPNWKPFFVIYPVKILL